jgi:heme/copper-type cytochrome/quinol oxidase subunit 1
MMLEVEECPILYQYLFWFFGNPEVNILIFLGLGLIFYIVSREGGGKRVTFGILRLDYAIVNIYIYIYIYIYISVYPRFRGMSSPHII